MTTTRCGFDPHARPGILKLGGKTIREKVTELNTNSNLGLGNALPGLPFTSVQFNDSGVFGGNAGFTFTKASVLATLTRAVSAGDYEALRILNSQANAAGATSETAQLRFGFGTDVDVARLIAGKVNDFSSASNSDAFLAFNIDEDGTSKEVCRISSTVGGGNRGFMIGKTTNPGAALDLIGFGSNLVQIYNSGVPNRNALTINNNGQVTFGGLAAGFGYVQIGNIGTAPGLVIYGDTSVSVPSSISFGYNTTGSDAQIAGVFSWSQAPGAGRPNSNQSVLDFAHNAQAISTSAPSMFRFSRSGNKTGLTAEDTFFKISGNATDGYTNGLADGTTLTNYRHIIFEAPVINGVAGGLTETVTNAATVYISGAPSGANITFTNGPYALWVAAGKVQFDGAVGFASAPTLSGFTTGSVLFAGASGAVSQDNAQFFWDDTNFRLGLLTSAPTGTFSIAEKTILNNSGLVTKYNNIPTVSNGMPAEYATIDSTGLTANVSASTLYAVPVSGAGMYRISSYVTETTVGSISSTLPNVQIVYTDADSNTSITIDATPVLGGAGIGQTGALTDNTVGTTSTGVIVVNAKASTTIQYKTVNYASNLAGMAYALHLKLEAM